MWMGFCFNLNYSNFYVHYNQWTVCVCICVHNVVAFLRFSRFGNVSFFCAVIFLWFRCREWVGGWLAGWLAGFVRESFILFCFNIKLLFEFNNELLNLDQLAACCIFAECHRANEKKQSQ